MVSIITVVRNGAATLEKTILSVLNQDYSDFEYIIVDGFSTDGTLKIIDQYSDKITKMISEPDKGIYDAMNKGIKLAKGDWIYFLGCDDILFKSTTLSDIFKDRNFEKLDVVYGNVLFLHSGIISDGSFDAEKMCTRSLCQQCILYRRSLFEKFGFFSTGFKTASDYVFNINVFCSAPEKWLYVDEIVTLYNELGASKSPDKIYLDESFAIRYDCFRNLVSKFVLSRIFWSSYFRYLAKHKISGSLKYLAVVFKDVGFLRLIAYLFIMLKKKYWPVSVS